MSTFTVSQSGGENDFNLAELDGPRMIIASEAKIESRLNEQLLKNYTGGEKVNAQRKHGRPFEFQPKGKIWMGLNHQPTVKDDSHGFWRRMQVITFPRTFDGSSVDFKLSEKLRHEAPGILAWAVRGCLRWQEEGLNPPLSVMLKVEEYKDEEDPNREFLMECLDFSDPDAEENMHELYAAYGAFCTKTGRRFIASRKSLGKYLSRKFEKRESNGKVIYRGVSIKFRPQERLY
jgi:putative DNA primase/helicase